MHLLASYLVHEANHMLYCTHEFSELVFYTCNHVTQVHNVYVFSVCHILYQKPVFHSSELIIILFKNIIIHQLLLTLSYKRYQ